MRSELRLSLVLAPNWEDISSGNPDGPATFAPADSDCDAALQISIHAEYTGGVIPDPTPAQLVTLAERVIERNGEADIRGRATGECAIGTYGTVLASTDEAAWFQIWFLSNGKDFVLASFISSEEPTDEQASQASWMVENLQLQRP
ncbi:hypothetical protein [Massilia sp. CF038]|uniref:hypothetical protein n=1 Tax=Massilia sp. CF038 TaxID=1881045 RepID=UPI0009143F7A|nr:hypothetical protein [Massilia sp. CF038]SHH09600.1 hypothetical protein SAMN05428948_2746 [Massilia sp. CF038]